MDGPSSEADAFVTNGPHLVKKTSESEQKFMEMDIGCQFAFRRAVSIFMRVRHFVDCS
jgi:hypothetical protein